MRVPALNADAIGGPGDRVQTVPAEQIGLLFRCQTGHAFGFGLPV
jgi:hypothetical protein